MEKISKPEVRLRPAQEKILEYEGGRLGISAVPGSGKTFTLSLLAAQLVQKLAASGPADDREVLVVTFTNSAVENFRQRINGFIEDAGLLPGVGYRVRTLHGLAHDIVRERPALVGLSEDFSILDERSSQEILREATHSYLQTHPDIFGPYVKPEFLDNPRRIERYLIDDALEIVNGIIRVAKNRKRTAGEMLNELARQSGSWPLLSMGLQIFSDYERSLQTRGAVDFDDLIVLALRALESDPDFLARLQDRWPYILEDEAQDSSLLQEEMLTFLTQGHGNWVRVGDPNQAINTTFTSADPRFLRNFLARPDVEEMPLPNSGRSAREIIDLANGFSSWSRQGHPVLSADVALTGPDILPTEPDDPQPNPVGGDPAIYLFDRPLTPEQELDVISTSLKRWLPAHPRQTAAVLLPDNLRGFHLVRSLERNQIPFDDTLLRSNNRTRQTAAALARILQYIARPDMSTHLGKLWAEVWWPRKGIPLLQREERGEDGEPESPFGDAELPEPVQTFARALDRISQPERYLFPGAGDDWLDGLSWLDEFEGMRRLAQAFRGDLRRWTAGTVLPIDELMLTLGNDLFEEPSDLALTHTIAVLLAKRVKEQPHLRLADLAGELDDIAQNRRRLPGFNSDSAGFEPPAGTVTVATMHAAKGLEWDRVYLASVSSYSFPSGADEESYRGERWFVRDRLNLTAEAIAQAEQLHMGNLDDYEFGNATGQARLDIAAERLRLLYVGITRARRELIVTYNTGRRPDDDPNQPALGFQALVEIQTPSLSADASG